MTKNDYSVQTKIPSGKSASARGLLILVAAVFFPIVIGGSSESVRNYLVSSSPELFAWIKPIYIPENNGLLNSCDRLDDVVSGFEHESVLTVGSSLTPVQRLVRKEGGDYFQFLRVFERERFVEQRSINPLGIVTEAQGRKADGGVWVKVKRYAYAVYDCGFINPTRLL